jgi:hypothetical protein
VAGKCHSLSAAHRLPLALSPRDSFPPRLDDDPNRQPPAVDQSVDFAALDPLAGVIAHLAVVTAPFSADLL